MADLRTALRERIDGFRTLGVQPGVALQLIELGRDPEAELEDYAGILAVSRSLSARFLALANSSWFAPRQPVATLKRAVAMIGLKHVRMLAISYCLEGLHNALTLDPEDAHAYWEAGLCRAIAARELSSVLDSDRADEAFAAALLQDMAVAVMAELNADYIPRLRNTETSVTEQMIYEVQRFGMDHAEAGGAIARALGLPEAYQRAIAGHHGRAVGADRTDADMIQRVSRTVAWLPHDMRCWTSCDAGRFDELLAEQFPGRWADAETFMGHVQADFAELSDQLSGDASEPTVLRQLCQQAALEAAANVSELVGEAHAAARQHERLSGIFDNVVGEQLEAAHRAEHDPLTGLLNREGFERRVNDLMAHAPATKVPLALAFFDCDRFKATNDQYGHDAGDALLRGVVSRIRANVRDSDLICRWGGDEFVILFLGLSEDNSIEIAQRALASIMRDPVAWQTTELPASVSGGLVWADTIGPEFEVGDLVSQADANLYVAKRHQRGSLAFRGKPLPTTTDPHAPAPAVSHCPVGAD